MEPAEFLWDSQIQTDRPVAETVEDVHLSQLFKCSTWSILSCFFGLLQPMVFGAMMHRDEAFDAIYAQYLQISTTAATTMPETGWLNADKTAP